jgi:hypothetical protein
MGIIGSHLDITSPWLGHQVNLQSVVLTGDLVQARIQPGVQFRRFASERPMMSQHSVAIVENRRFPLTF